MGLRRSSQLHETARANEQLIPGKVVRCHDHWQSQPLPPKPVVTMVLSKRTNALLREALIPLRYSPECDLLGRTPMRS